MLQRRRLLAALALTPVAGATGADAASLQDPQAGRDAPGHALTGAFSDIRGAGAKSDGVTNDGESILRAAKEGGVVFPRGVTLVAHDLVVPSYAVAVAGAMITVARGATLTFAAGFWAPLAHVFAGEGVITFAEGSQRVAYPEWWGARIGERELDCAPAINACIEASPITLLQQGAYHIRSPIFVRGHGRTLRGVNESQDAAKPSTQIIIDDAEAPGVVCGRDSASRPDLIDYITLENFAVGRSRPAPASVHLTKAPAGVRLMWCALLHVNRVTVWNHPVGFYVFGCVESYFDQCSALHGDTIQDSSAAHVCGFYLDYSAPLGLAGGNASIYLDRCRAFGHEKTSFGYSAGLASAGGFVDLLISKFETGFQQYGIDLRGDGTDSNSYSTQNCHIVNCFLDSNDYSGVRIQSAGRHCDVHVSGCYIDLRNSKASSACLYLGGADASSDGIGGTITASNCEFVGDYAGVVATNVAVCTLALNTHLDLQAPVAFLRVHDSEVRDVIRLLHPARTPSPAVRLEHCERISVSVSVSGISNAFRGGVSLDGDTRRVEVNVTRIDEGAVGGAGQRVLVDGSPWKGGLLDHGNVVTGAV